MGVYVPQRGQITAIEAFNVQGLPCKLSIRRSSRQPVRRQPENLLGCESGAHVRRGGGVVGSLQAIAIG